MTLHTVELDHCFEFPINRRHQGLATVHKRPIKRQWKPDFQSIGVTKDWRQPIARLLAEGRPNFQSIGVTKDWRHANGAPASVQAVAEFPINRRHQGLATGAHGFERRERATPISNQ